MRVLVACLLLGTIALSGCLGEVVDDKDTRPRSVQRRPYAAPASPAGPTLTVSPVELDGRTTTYACLIAPVTTWCQGIQGGNALQTFADGDDKAIRLNGNLTWISETPATERLNAYLVVDGRYQYGYPVAFGPSPILVDFDLTSYAGHNLAIGISSTNCICPVAGGVVLAGPQDFAFRGEFTSELG